MSNFKPPTRQNRHSHRLSKSECRAREIVCRCNNISRETIEKAIFDGSKTPNEIFDATNAGVGPCGGSCRKTWVPWLEYFLLHKTLPKSDTD